MSIQIAPIKSNLGCGCGGKCGGLGELPALSDLTAKLKAIDNRTWLLIAVAAAAAAYLVYREVGEVRTERRRRRG